MSVDSITLEIIRNALTTIAKEMTLAIERTSRSPAVNECRDFATVIMDSQGQLIAQGLGAPSLMAATSARRRTEPGLTPNRVENERLVLESVRVAVEVGVDVNAVDDAGNTALHTAASRRLDTVVQFLADSGANLNAYNEEGQTPLTMAAGRGDAEDNATVELLRRLGAEI